jgi:hypothetical protein
LLVRGCTDTGCHRDQISYCQNGWELVRGVSFIFKTSGVQPIEFQGSGPIHLFLFGSVIYHESPQQHESGTHLHEREEAE